MLATLSRSWELVKQSAEVLRMDRELMLFPVFSTLAIAVATVSFFVPLHLMGFFGAVLQSGAAFGGTAGYVGLFLLYFVDAAS